jgi:hypothetical protein
MNPEDDTKFSLTASNASLWFFNGEIPEAGGFLVQIDHLNHTGRAKFTRAMRCQQMPENYEQEDKCKTLNVDVSI